MSTPVKLVIMARMMARMEPATEATLLAAADRDDLRAVVVESPFDTYRDTVAHHITLFRGFRWWLSIVPAWPVTDEVLFWMGRKGGFDPDAADVHHDGGPAWTQGFPVGFRSARLAHSVCRFSARLIIRKFKNPETEDQKRKDGKGDNLRGTTF